ncbi:MAG: hypothetical protein ACYDBQ_09530 [Thermoplasmatota archaeon]
MGWLTALKIGGGAVAVVVALAGTAYASDYPVQATVTAKACASGSGFGVFSSPAGPGSVTVTTKLFGIQYTVHDLPATQCDAVQVNNFVVYHIRTQRTSLYDREGGSCIYDSVGGVGGCPA